MTLECTQKIRDGNKEYLHQLNRKVAQHRVPLSGSIDLTHQCNLKCIHCYLGDETKNRDRFKKELDTTRWIDLIDKIADAGCLFLLITGGEPLLRKDFAEIYTRAKTNGLLVTVFTNGTLITDSIIDLFRDLPPYTIEISLYGATSATCDSITGVKGSFKKCINGIQRLLDHHINLKLKTMLMTPNRHEFYAIKNMAKAYGVKFRFDAAIFPRFNGDKTPLRLRVSLKEAVEKEFSEDGHLNWWKDFYKKMGEIPESDILYRCGAGHTSFHIDSLGNLKPCLMATNPTYNLALNGEFLTGWHDVMPRLREKRVDLKGSACHRCEKKSLCGYCPAFFELETGAEDIPSEYLCTMGQYRFEKVCTTF